MWKLAPGRIMTTLIEALPDTRLNQRHRRSLRVGNRRLPRVNHRISPIVHRLHHLIAVLRSGGAHKVMRTDNINVIMADYRKCISHQKRVFFSDVKLGRSVLKTMAAWGI